MLSKILRVNREELKPALLSFGFFFFLMSSYFIMRPVRDEMGIAAGIEHLQWLFTGTFIVMLSLVPLFGWLMKSIPRKELIPKIYSFFVFNILGFYFCFEYIDIHFTSIVFFIWLSVYNLFVVSIFWSINSDIFNSKEAKRLYGPIAAGGSIGAISGPLITTLLVGKIGISNLLLISASLLTLSTLCIKSLLKELKSSDSKKRMEGGTWKGLQVLVKSPLLMHTSLFIILYTMVSTFLYFEQAYIISSAYSFSAERTSYFGYRDLSVNMLTLIIQLLLTNKISGKYGGALGLVIVPLVALFGFLGLGISHTVPMLFVFQVLHRSLNFSIQRPTRETLFASMSANEKYRSKNFMDTALYRGGDAFSGWLFALISSLVSSLQIVSFLAIPVAFMWIITALKIGKLSKVKSLTQSL